MIVHNDTYNPGNQKGSVVELHAGKVMGLSLAYCDNDSPEEYPPKRDHFFGSVYVPLEAYNDHWMQANWFGVAKLTENTTTSAPYLYEYEPINIKSYSANKNFYTSVTSSVNGLVTIRVYNIFGSEIFAQSANKISTEWNTNFSLKNWKSGIYIIEIIHANTKKATKIVVQ